MTTQTGVEGEVRQFKRAILERTGPARTVLISSYSTPHSPRPVSPASSGYKSMTQASPAARSSISSASSACRPLTRTPVVTFLDDYIDRSRADGSHSSDTPPATPSSCDSGADCMPPTHSLVPLTESVRQAARRPNGGFIASGDVEVVDVTADDSGFEDGVFPRSGTDNFWIGQRLADKRLTSKTPMLRHYWEQNSERDRQEQVRQEQMAQQRQRKPFGFPKWRSNDAMTASLVASGKVPNMIPKDSNLPEHRRQKLEETERKAEAERVQLQQMVAARKPLHKGKSLESLTMQVDYQPWYDRERIKEAISRESIANLGSAKEKFERGDFERSDSNRTFGVEFGHSRSVTPFSQSSRSVSAAPSRHAHAHAHVQQNGHNANGHHHSHHHQHHNYPQQQQQQQHQSYRPGHSPPPAPTHQHHHHHQPQLYQPSSNNGYFGPNNGHPIEREEIPSTTQSADDRSPPANNLSPDHFVLLQYIKQNPTVFNDFGIQIPKNLSDLVEQLPFGRSSESASQCVGGGVRQPAPIAPVQPTPQKNGRFVKNSANGHNVSRFRKTFDMTQKQVPENRRQSVQELDQQKAGDNLIAAEIRAMREREEELRRSRSELGLPSLEDTFESWRHGARFTPTDLSSPNQQMRSAQSYNHLNHFNGSDFGEEISSLDEASATASGAARVSHEQHLHPEQRQHPAHAPTQPQPQPHHSRQQQHSQSGDAQQQQQQFASRHTAISGHSQCQSTTQKPQNQQPIIFGTSYSPKERPRTTTTAPGPNGSGTTHTANGGGPGGSYKLLKSQDPDVMIYGPSMRRNANGSLIKLTESPAFGQSVNGLRNIRYE